MIRGHFGLTVHHPTTSNMPPRLGAGLVRSARGAMPPIPEAGQVRPFVGSASCSFSSPTRSSIFKNEFSLLASFEFIFNGSLFGFLRVIASFSLVSWCGKQAMRTRARQQASESSRDSRELPGIAVLFSGVVAPTNEEKRLKRSFQGCKP